MERKGHDVIAFRVDGGRKKELGIRFGKKLPDMLRGFVIETLEGNSPAKRLINSRLRELGKELKMFDEVLESYEEVGDDSGCERIQRNIAQNKNIQSELTQILNGL